MFIFAQTNLEIMYDVSFTIDGSCYLDFYLQELPDVGDEILFDKYVPKVKEFLDRCLIDDDTMFNVIRRRISIGFDGVKKIILFVEPIQRNLCL